MVKSRTWDRNIWNEKNLRYRCFRFAGTAHEKHPLRAKRVRAGPKGMAGHRPLSAERWDPQSPGALTATIINIYSIPEIAVVGNALGKSIRSQIRKEQSNVDILVWRDRCRRNAQWPCRPAAEQVRDELWLKWKTRRKRYGACGELERVAKNHVSELFNHRAAFLTGRFFLRHCVTALAFLLTVSSRWLRTISG